MNRSRNVVLTAQRRLVSELQYINYYTMHLPHFTNWHITSLYSRKNDVVHSKRKTPDITTIKNYNSLNTYTFYETNTCCRHLSIVFNTCLKSKIPFRMITNVSFKMRLQTLKQTLQSNVFDRLFQNCEYVQVLTVSFKSLNSKKLK